MTTAAPTERTLAELVAENPARAVVLDHLGLDFCCHGNRSLSDACAAAGLDPDSVRTALDDVAEVPSSWSGGGRADLASYVEAIQKRVPTARQDRPDR